MWRISSIICAGLLACRMLVSGASDGGEDLENVAKERFESLTLMQTQELIEWLKEHRPVRALTQWHIHHTWDPRYADFNGGNHAELQFEMWKLHVCGNGWDDIGQHVTLFPDGLWMLGRSLELDPASIRGWNRGAVAVEMVGNFDKGGDLMSDLQKSAIVQMSQFMVHEWRLDLHFHRDHPEAGKTCPGSSIDRDDFIKLIQFPDSCPDALEFQR